MASIRRALFSSSSDSGVPSSSPILQRIESSSENSFTKKQTENFEATENFSDVVIEENFKGHASRKGLVGVDIEMGKQITGLPLTPESPDDDLEALSRRATRIIEESEKQCLLGYHKDNYVPKVSEALESDDEPDLHVGQEHASFTQQQQQQQQQAPYCNSEFSSGRAPINTHNYSRSTASTSYHDASYYQRDHNSWTFPQEYVAGHVTQGAPSYPTGATYGDHLKGHHMDSQLFYNHDNLPGIYQYYHTPTASTQLPYRPPSQCLSENPQALPSTQCIGQALPSAQGDVKIPSTLEMCSPAYMVTGKPGTKDMKITILPDDMSKHSSKERIRRERIKESCDKLRFLLPNISGKKDMASILEMTVKFVRLVTEKIPPDSCLMQEITETLSTNNMGLGKKRSQKETMSLPSKQPKLRVLSSQTPVTMVSPIMSADSQGHFRLKGPPMTSNTGPVYLPHIHGPHFGANQHPLGLNYGATYNPLANTHTSVANQGITGNVPKDMYSFSTQPVNDTQMYHNYQPINSQVNVVCPHRQMMCQPPLAVNTSTLTDMPKQWGFLKLPPISTLSPCSSSHPSQSSSKDLGSSSDISSPNTSLDSPSWSGPKVSASSI